MKCDETKPECNRCVKFGWKCDGYEETRTRSSRPGNLGRRLLLPNIQAGSLFSSVPKDISKCSFDNEGQRFFFTYYCQKTAHELSGTFETLIWNKLLLQASDDQSFIRYGLVVIGALSRSMKIGIARNTLDDEKLLAPEFDTEWIKDECLLFHYNKFLRASRMALSERAYDKRLALIVCLMVICIERLQWRLFTAVQHIRSGMDLLDEWVESRIDRQNALPYSTTGLDSINDEIVQYFGSLDIEASIFLNTKPKLHSRNLRHEGKNDIIFMPQSFTTVSEARSFLEHICEQTLSFIHNVRLDKRISRSPFYGLETTPNFNMGSDSDPLLPPNDDVDRENNLELPGNVASSMRFEQEIRASKIRQWSAAFKPLLTFIPTTDNNFPNARILELRSLAIKINLTGSLSSTELVYDSLLPEFKGIVALAKSYLSHPHSSKITNEGSFSLTSGMSNSQSDISFLECLASLKSLDLSGE